MTADGRTIALEGAELNVREAGDGPAVLLLHSLGVSGWLWTEVMRELSARHRVISPDFPGYGGSPRPDSAWMIQDYAAAIVELGRALDVDRWHVVGNSFGAVVAVEVLAQAPELADRVALLGLPLWPDEGGRREWLRSRSAPLAPDGSAPAATLETAAALIQGPTPDMVAAINADRARTGSWYLQTMWALAAYDPAPRLQRLERPTLVAYGEHDPFRSGAELAAGLLPDATVGVVAGGGHFAPLDAPVETADALGRFLANGSAP